MPAKPTLNTVQRELVMNQLVARLATSTSIGEPYLIPVTFVPDSNCLKITLTIEFLAGPSTTSEINILS